MIAAFDVHYDDRKSIGATAAAVFARWDDGLPAAEYTTVIQNIQPYVPGKFFRRELPCLIAVIDQISEPADLFVVDSFAWLDGKPGLGQHLFEHFAKRVPVMGVAKTRFHGAAAVEDFRGVRKSPLYLKAVGIDTKEAATHIREMYRQHWHPTPLQTHCPQAVCSSWPGEEPHLTRSFALGSGRSAH